jgi:hypothetical protein
LGWFFVPKGQEDSAQGFNPDLYTEFGETADTWKASPDGATNTAYARLLSGANHQNGKYRAKAIPGTSKREFSRKAAMAIRPASKISFSPFGQRRAYLFDPASARIKKAKRKESSRADIL